MGHDPKVTRSYSFRKPAANVAAYRRASEGSIWRVGIDFHQNPRNVAPGTGASCPRPHGTTMRRRCSGSWHSWKFGFLMKCLGRAVGPRPAGTATWSRVFVGHGEISNRTTRICDEIGDLANRRSPSWLRRILTHLE